jgi:uncharacterized RDD family membrane protein YckC
MTDVDPYKPPEVRVADRTPESEGPQLATRGARLLARLLDGTLYLVPMFVVGMLLEALGRDLEDGSYLLIFLPPVVVFCVNLGLLAQMGQTIGKLVLGVRIVRIDGARAGVLRIFLLRMFIPSALGSFPIVGPIFGLVNVLLIFREDRRCVHDLFADTVVVTA